MKLSKVSARNFKGQSFDLDLTAGVVLVGSNFAGKSARTDAIRLLLLGHLPELGKQPRATFGLSSGREMEVRGTFETGLEIWRKWTLRGDSVVSTNNIDDLDGGIFDGKDGAFSVLLNAETYFALSERDRVAYVFANCPLPAKELLEFSPAGVADKLRKALREHDAKLLDELLFAVDNGVGALFKDEPPPAAYLEAFLSATEIRAKVARENANRMEKSVQGLAQLRAADENVGPSVASLEDEIGRLTREVSGLTETRGRLVANLGAIKNGRVRAAEINRAIAAGEKDRADLGALQSKLDMVRSDPAYAAPLGVDLEVLRAECTALQIELGRSEDDRRRAQKDREDAADGLSDLAMRDVCPYCGSKGDAWKGIREAELEDRAQNSATAEASFVKASADLKARHEERTGVLARARETSGRREALAQEERRILAAVAPIEGRLARLSALAEELARIPAEDPALEKEVEDVQQNLNVHGDELRRLESRRKLALGRAADLTRLAEAEAAREKARGEYEVAKGAADAVRGIQADLVASAFRPLLAQANEIFGSVLRSPIAYNAGEIGTWRDGAWVGHRTFSGTEKALTYAAIQIALAANAPVRLMILDELGRLDEGNLRKVHVAVAEALFRKQIEQFVGIDAGRREIHVEPISVGDRGVVTFSFNVVEIK